MRVLVFRPPSDAERTAEAVAARGFEPVVASLFSIVPLPAPAPEGDFAALVVTSGNAAPLLSRGPTTWRDLPVFTVGARTAAKVREAGLADTRSADGDRNDLIALVERTLPAPSAVLLVAGRDRKDDVAERLRSAGYEVVLWEAYAAEPVATLPEAAVAAIRDGNAEAAMHYSARGAETFVGLCRAASLADAALSLTHVAISADAAAPLISAGASTVLVAEHPEEAAMLAALQEISQRGAVLPGAPVEPPRASPRRTPPVIELTAESSSVDAASLTSPDSGAEGAAPEVARPKPSSVGDGPPEAVAPTEALAREFSPPPPDASVPGSEPDRGSNSGSGLPWAALAAAGVVGGLIGAGLVVLALRSTQAGVSPDQLATVASRLEGLQTAVAASDRKASAAGEAVGKVGADLQTLTGRIGDQPSATDAAAVQRAEAAAAAAAQKADAISARLATVESQARAASGPSAQATAAVRIVLAERIARALDAGRAFAHDAAALGKLGVAPAELAPLSAVASTGAATRSALQAGFRRHGTMFQREVTPQSQSWSDTLWGLASRVVTVRPVGDSGSHDPATLPLRLDSAIAAGDFPKAAALWAQLPEPARRASAEFGEALQKRAAADAAIAKIGQDAVTALGAAG